MGIASGEKGYESGASHRAKVVLVCTLTLSDFRNFLCFTLTLYFLIFKDLSLAELVVSEGHKASPGNFNSREKF